MQATTNATEDVMATCSFCGRPDTDVQRLVAGPGVFICNDCIGLCAWVVEGAARATPEESARRRTEFRNPSSEDVLALLPALVASADRVEAELAASVSRLRERGTDWQTIADAASMSVETARRRFGAAPAQ